MHVLHPARARQARSRVRRVASTAIMIYACALLHRHPRIECGALGKRPGSRVARRSEHDATLHRPRVYGLSRAQFASRVLRYQGTHPCHYGGQSINTVDKWIALIAAASLSAPHHICIHAATRHARAVVRAPVQVWLARQVHMSCRRLNRW